MTEQTLTHEDLIRLTEWMASQDYEASEVAEAVRKPWKYRELLTEAYIAVELDEIA